MPLEPPNLDDRTFADLFAEARSLIPRYAPEWTNHNDSDPGITLLQLFSWLTEQTVYRLNRVPDRNYLKFLQLLGIQTRPARPARVDVTFTLARPDSDAFVIVPKGTQVATAGGDAPPVVFETGQALVALGARLAAVQIFDAYAYSDATTANGIAGQDFAPFGAHAHEGAALLLGFSSPLPFVDQSIDLACYAQPRSSGHPGLHCDTDQLVEPPPPAELAYEFWDGAHWETLGLEADGTRAFSRDGHLVLVGPGTAASRATIGAVGTALYWLRVRLVTSQYEVAPRLSAVRTNTIAAVAAQTAADEVLGGSDGTPAQGPFRLGNRPVLERDEPLALTRTDGTPVTVASLQLEVDEGGGFEPWQEVADFVASGPDDPHYVLDHTTGQVTFGDGRTGRIPVANPANPSSNIVARSYSYGGGKGTNVGAGTVTTLRTFAEGVKSATNFAPALGGADEETVDDAKRRAPAMLAARDRAVTADDFVTLALATPQVVVRRAQALPLYHPEFPDVPVPGVVSVIVVPDGDGPAPLPSDVTLRAVCRHLNAHRLVTNELYVLPPTYRSVLVTAEIVARPDADLASLRRALAGRIAEYFHPLTGGADGTGWPFGGTIYYSTLCRVLLDVPGVDRIRDNQLTVTLDRRVQPFCRDVEIGVGRLIASEPPDLRVSYS
jgi:predicted phage baseplate assembly protein